MPIDFSLISQAPSAAARFMEGQEAARSESERNMLRQMQMEQMAMSRENMLAQQAERQALAAERRRATEAQNALAAYAQSGQPMTPEALGRFGAPGLALAKTLREERAAQLDQELKVLDYASRRLAAATPDTYPAIRADLTRVNPQFGAGLPQEFDAERVLALARQGMSLKDQLESATRQTVVAPGATLVQGGKPIYTAPAASKLLTPEEEAQKIRIAKEGRPATTVVLPPQEKAEQTERGKLLVKQYGNVSDAARLAAKTLPSLETQERVLDSGFKTGFGTDAQKAGASVLAALGVPEAEKYATNAQTFLSATQQAVLQRQLEQKGPQTEADAQRITQTGAQLGNTPEANKFIIATAKAQLKRDIAQRNFYDNWWQKNKTYDGAEDAWFSGEGGKSLFEDSALKKFAPALAKPASATTAPASAGVQPFSDAAKERRYQEWKRSQGKP